MTTVYTTDSNVWEIYAFSVCINATADNTMRSFSMVYLFGLPLHCKTVSKLETDNALNICINVKQVPE